MTEHMMIKKKVQKIGKKSDFNEILENSLLNDREKEMMTMYYIERKDMDYIADIMGYSKAGIIKMHKRCLNKIETLL